MRWLTYLARRLDGLDLVLLVALRPADPAFANAPLLALRAEAPTILSPALLSENAVGALVRATLGSGSNDELCEAVWTASGGNPLMTPCRTITLIGAFRRLLTLTWRYGGDIEYEALECYISDDINRSHLPGR